jgi:lipopolysaccharide export system permease protein
VWDAGLSLECVYSAYMLRATRLPAYLVREVAPLYLVGLAGILILLLIDLFSVLAAFILSNHPPATLVLRTVIDRMPFFLSYMLAPGLAFAVLVGLGRLAKDSELKAAYSTGVSPAGLLLPLILLGVAVGAVSFVNSNFWQPGSDERFNADVYEIVRNQPLPNYKEVQSFPDPASGTLFHAGTVTAVSGEPLQARLDGVMVITGDGTYTAPTGLWDAERKVWELYNAFLTKETDASGQTEPARSDTLTFPFNSDLTPLRSDAKYLSFTDLRDQLRDPSLSVEQRYEAVFQMNRRFNDPLAPVAMALVGGALGLTVRNRAWAFTWVILLVFGYYVAWTFGTNLAASRAVTPALAAWLPSIVFFLGGIVTARRLS